MSDKFVVSTNEIGRIIVTDVETGNVYHHDNLSHFLGLIRLLNEQQSIICRDEISIKTMMSNMKKLEEENKQLRQMIKAYVFGRYVEGSLADLKFKAIAYDDIVKLDLSNESEPKVIVICKQGKKANVKSFCQMFIPFGISYEIKEVS